VLAERLYVLANLALLTSKNRNIIPLCDADEESVSDILNEELDIESDDEVDLEIEGETVSEQ
jgi:hypothetical protein